MLCAWEPDFTGYVIDYGAWPEQKRNYFTRKDIRKRLSHVYAGDESGMVFSALTDLGEKLCGQTYTTMDGRELELSRWCIDGNWRDRSAAVVGYARQSPFANRITVTQGRGVKASENPFSQAQRATKWRTGHGSWFWQDGPGPARWVTFDANIWKKRVHNALTLSAGSRGGITLFNAQPAVHRMLADHLRAENAIKVEARGRTVYEWKEIPGRDNEGLDCLVGNCVAASIAGISRESERRPAKKQRKSLAEYYGKK
jgi:phage terminase large subunit GpA-like protein